jgi:acyl carrier protein
MIAYLDNRDPYWKTRKYYAIYSTNCPIKQIGDYGHLQSQGFHYYGAATSWEKRVGHLTMENVKEDLQCNVTAKGYEKFLKRIGYPQDKTLDSSDKYLCAYIVPDKSGNDSEMSVSDLKESLLKQLPQYMIPAHVEQLAEIPLTSNGKIARNALPMPNLSRVQHGVTYVAPKTDIERLIAETWQEVLKVDKVGTRDNFFDLGGNSLDIVMVGGKLKEALGREIPAVTLFTYPTIRSLERYLTGDQGEESLQEDPSDHSELIDEGKDFMQQTLKKLENGG